MCNSGEYALNPAKIASSSFGFGELVRRLMSPHFPNSGSDALNRRQRTTVFYSKRGTVV